MSSLIWSFFWIFLLKDHCVNLCLLKQFSILQPVVSTFPEPDPGIPLLIARYMTGENILHRRFWRATAAILNRMFLFAWVRCKCPFKYKKDMPGINAGLLCFLEASRLLPWLQSAVCAKTAGKGLKTITIRTCRYGSTRSGMICDYLLIHRKGQGPWAIKHIWI